MGQDIPERLKEARKHLNLNQIQIADDLNIQQKSISDIENGKILNIPNTYICYFYKKGISLDWIYDGTGPILIDSPKNQTIENKNATLEGLFKDMNNMNTVVDKKVMNDVPSSVGINENKDLYERIIDAKEYNIKSLFAYIKSLENNLEFIKDLLDKSLSTKILNGK